MFDYIQSSISTLNDRREILRSLTLSDQPWMRLLVDCDACTVALWIADGKRIAHARVIPEGPDGNLAMLTFLRSTAGKFQLELVENGAGGGRDLDISLSKLLDDEAQMLGFIDACAHSERMEGDPDETQDSLPAVQMPAAASDTASAATQAAADQFGPAAPPDPATFEKRASTDAPLPAPVEKLGSADVAPATPATAAPSGIFATPTKQEPSVVADPAGAAADPDDSAKIRQELEFANSLYSQSKDAFYVSAPELQQHSENDLHEKRQKEFEYLSQFYSGEDKSFEQTNEVLAEAEKSGSLSEGQKQLLDAVSVFTDPTAFAEVDPEIAKGKQSEMEPLNDLQKRVLELSAAESDPSHFAAHDPVMADNKSLRPTAAEPLEHPEMPVFEELAEAPSTYSPSESTDNNAKTGAEGGPDVKAFLRRENKDANHSVAAFIPERFRGKRLPTAVIVAGIAVLVLLPPAILATNYLGQQSDDDAAQRRAAEALAERSMEDKSVVAQTKEASFRLPQGSANNGDPPDTSAPGPQDKPESHFEYHEPKNPQSLSAAQMDAAAGDIQKADAMLSSGYGNQAISMYLSVLQRYPTYTALRVKAARAYMAIKDYQHAYQVLVSGLEVCQTRSDFDMLVSVIHEIP